MTGPEFYKPPRIALYGEMTSAFSDYKNEIAERLDIQTPEEAAQYNWEVIYFHSEENDYFSNPVDSSVLGADQIRIGNVLSFESHDAFEVELQLFRDGKLYVNEADEDNEHDYVLIVTPERLPAVVNSRDYIRSLRELYATGADNAFPANRLEYIERYFGDYLVHELSDQECAEVIAALPIIKSDINFKWFRNNPLIETDEDL